MRYENQRRNIRCPKVLLFSFFGTFPLPVWKVHRIQWQWSGQEGLQPGCSLLSLANFAMRNNLYLHAHVHACTSAQEKSREKIKRLEEFANSVKPVVKGFQENISFDPNSQRGTAVRIKLRENENGSQIVV